MVVRRDSLRAQTDFFSPMTGNTSPRLASAPRGKYGDEVKSRMAGMGEVRSTRTNPIQAAFVELIKTEDPFTEIDTKKSYAPEEEEGLAEALGGLGDGTSDVAERVEEFLEPITGGGGGGSKPNVVTSNPNDRIASMSTQQLVDRDNRMYGNTVPEGSFGSGSKKTIESSPGSAVDTNINRHKEGGPDDQPPTIKFEKPKPNLMYGQGGLPLGTTAPRQVVKGMTTGVKDGIKVEAKPKVAINASGFQQANVRGSGNPNNTGKDESQRPKQTVASLPSNYAATEKKAFEAAKAYKASKADSQAKGDAAAKATNTPSKPPAGSFGISDKGRAQAAVNKAQAQKKSSPSTSKSSPSTSKSSTSTSKSSTSTSKSQGRGGARGGSSGGSGSSSKGGSKSGGSKSGGSTGRGGSRGGSSGGSGSSSRGGTGSGGTKTSRTASKASKSRTGRSKTRCDIRTKVDISVLTNMDLIKDDLANVAYFVKELQETN